jgi:hypothetical protein
VGGQVPPAAAVGRLAEALGQVLRAHGLAQRQLAAACRLVGEAAVRRDPAAVLAAVADQQRALGEAAGTAAAVRATMAALARALDLPEDVGIRGLTGGLRRAGLAPAAAGVEELAAEVRGAAAEVARLNAANGLLLRQALAFTRFALGLLGAAGQDGPGYPAAGTPPMPVRRWVDTTA